MSEEIKHDSKVETLEHKQRVSEAISMVIVELLSRSANHDNTKMGPLEKPYFDEYSSKLKTVTFGSEQYKEFLSELKPALDNHYRCNRHHPEHFENGIKDMNLIDVMEMFSDWYASSKRHADGNIIKSIEINKNRFGYTDELESIFKNTAKFLEDNQ